MTEKSIGDQTENSTLPPCSGTAVFAAMAFIKLGGDFSISQDGKRYVGRPEACLFTLQGQPLPQFDDAAPWEQFLNADQWNGALRLLQYVLHRLDPADKEFVFATFAPVAIHPNSNFDFRDRLS